MKLTINRRIIKAILTYGFVLTGIGCGTVEDSPYYKSESIISGSENPTTVTNTATSPADMNVGDIYTIIFDDKNEGLINFEETDKDADFILAINTLDTNQVSRTVQLTDGSVAFNEMEDSSEESVWTGYSANEALDQGLRGIEMELSSTKGIPPAANLSTLISKTQDEQPTIGDIKSFKVLNSLSSLNSYATVRAKAKCIGERVIFYVDTQTISSELTDSDISKLCTDFDTAAAKEYELFGEPSDVNGDSLVTVLMTPQVNKLGAMGGGIITGFFFASDLYSGSDSNSQEIIYTLVPDSTGTFGVAIPKFFAMDNLLPAVLPHELQHAINYNQKVFVANGSSEENWLNEGLSHMAEDLVGFGQENPSRIEMFLSNPSYYGPISAGAPNLAERGASFLFLRYLYEQASDGSEFLWNLTHSNQSGAANIEAAFAGPEENFDQLSEFLLRWSAAIVMESFDLSSDPRFSYRERAFNDETNHWEGVCLNCDAEDGRGTLLSGISIAPYYGVMRAGIEATASKFYGITSFPNDIRLKAKDSGTYGATLIRFK